MSVQTGRLIRTVLAVVVVGFLVYYVDPSAMAEAAADTDLRWVAAAVALMPANVALEGIVWIRLARHVDPGLTTRDGFGALLAGFALGFFTPARAGDYAGRAFYVRHRDKWEIAAVVAVQRLLDVAVGSTAGSIALFIYLAIERPETSALWWALGSAGALIGLALVGAGLRPATAYRITRRLAPVEFVHRRLRFLERLSPREGAHILGLNLIRFGIYTSQFVLLIRALIPGVSAGVAYLGVGIIFLAKFLIPSVTLMDLGIREGIAVFVFGEMGLPEAAALNASLLLFTINLLLPALAGIWFVLQMRWPHSESPTSSADRTASS